MKRHLLTLAGTFGLLLAVASVHARIAGAQSNLPTTQPATSAGPGSNAAVPGDVIAVGPPALTRQAADSALDFIAFTASEVRHVKNMEIDQAMRDKWATYLAVRYPMLAPADRMWFASAPDTMAALRADWPRIGWVNRMTVRQHWAEAMPGILQFVAPVVLTSQEGASRQSLAWHLGDMIRQQQLINLVRQQQQSAATARDLAVQKELFNNGARSITLQTGMQSMANDTINLMHSYSH